MIRVELAVHGLIVGGSASFRDGNSMLQADAVNFAAGRIQGLLILAHSLDANRSFLLLSVADGPLNDTEVDTVLFTRVQA